MSDFFRLLIFYSLFGNTLFTLCSKFEVLRDFVRAICLCWIFLIDFIIFWLEYLNINFRHRTSTTHIPPATISSTTSPAPESDFPPAGPPAAGSGAWTSPGDIVELLSSGAPSPRVAAPEDRLVESSAPDVFREYPQRPGAIVV